jgi:hypothetical protein
MRKILLILLALAAIRLLPRAIRRQADTLALITALFETVALAATANTSKAYATEQRVTAAETRVGNLEQGVLPNLQPSSTIGQIQAKANAAITTAGGTVSSLTVTGPLSVQGNAGVTGNITVYGTSGLQGIVTCGSTCGVNGTLYVAGTANLEGAVNTGNPLTVGGNCGVHGNLNYTGSLNHV